MSNSPAPTDVPPSFQILTPRLIIRPATTTPADLPALLDHFTNPAATSEPQTTLTEEVLAQRIEKWAAMRAEGRNAWLIIRLREDGGGEEGRLIGFGGYNAFPRTKMMNSAERKGDAEEEGAEKVLAGDLGVAIDARYQRMVSLPPLFFSFFFSSSSFLSNNSQHESKGGGGRERRRVRKKKGSQR